MYILRSIFTVFSVEIALTLGVIIFAISLLRWRPIVTLPSRSRRATLASLGIIGPLVILVVATITNWLSMTDPLIRTGGWWQRPAPLLTAALVVAVAALALRSTPLPAPGERAISPRRRWWTFIPRTPLLISIAAATLLLLTTAWHTVIGVSLPNGANRYGVGPESDGLPGFMRMQGDMGYVWGAGWPNHLATLLALAAAAAAMILALSADANRPVFARATASDVKEERTATARLIALITIGGLLLTLGAVWAHVGFVGEIIVSVFEDNGGQGDPERFVVGTGYRDLASPMHLGGYVVQGLGAAILLRLMFDTARAAWTARKSQQQGEQDPALATVQTSEGAAG